MSPTTFCGNLKRNNFSDVMLSRNITVPRPGIRVGFIPGGSTDSVSFQLVILMSIPGHDDGRDGDCHVLLWIPGGDVSPWKP